MDLTIAFEPDIFSLGNNGMHLNVVNTCNLVADETSYDKDARMYLAKVSQINQEKNKDKK